MYRSDPQAHVTTTTTSLKGPTTKSKAMQGEPFLRHTTARDGGVNGVTSPQRKSARKYETFVMTGDMMIRTTSDHDDLVDLDIKLPGKKKEIQADRDSHIPEGSAHKKKKTEHSRSKIPKFNTGAPSPKPIPRNSSIPTAVNNTNQNKSPVLVQKKSPKSAQKKIEPESVQESLIGLPAYSKQTSKDSPMTSKKNAPQSGYCSDNMSPLSSPKVKVKGAATPVNVNKPTSGIPTKISKIPTKDAAPHEKPLGVAIKGSQGDNAESREHSGSARPVREVFNRRTGGNDSITGVSSAVRLQQTPSSGDHNSRLVSMQEISQTAKQDNNTMLKSEPPSSNNQSNLIIKDMNSSSGSADDRNVCVLSEQFPAINDLFPKDFPTPQQISSHSGWDQRSPFEEFHRPVYHACESVPIQLDIPPDDICSEDERFSGCEDGLFDVDNLPPPPEELLRDFEEKYPTAELSVRQDIHIGGAFFVENIRNRAPPTEIHENTSWIALSENNKLHGLESSLQNDDCSNNTAVNTENGCVEGGRHVMSFASNPVMPTPPPPPPSAWELEERGEMRRDSDQTEFYSSSHSKENCHTTRQQQQQQSIDGSHSSSIISGENTQTGTPAAFKVCPVTAGNGSSSDQSHTNKKITGYSSSSLNHVDTQGTGLPYNTATGGSFAGVVSNGVSVSPAPVVNGTFRDRTYNSIEADTPAVNCGAVYPSPGEAGLTSNNAVCDPVADLFTSRAISPTNSTHLKDSTHEDGSSGSSVNRLVPNSCVSGIATPELPAPGKEGVEQCNINDRAQPAPVCLPPEDLHQRGGHFSPGSSSGNNTRLAEKAPAGTHEDFLDHVLDSQTPMDSSFNAPTPPTTDLALINSAVTAKQLDAPQSDNLGSQVAGSKAVSVATNGSLMTQNEEPFDGSVDPVLMVGGNHDDDYVIKNDHEAVHSDTTDEFQSKRGMVTSFSGEGFAFKTLPNKVSQASARDSPMLVRTSKSHENYLDNQEMTMINIDFGDDFASSVDALHYDQSSTSLDKFNGYTSALVDQSKSVDNSPERRYEKYSERIHMPTFFRIDEPSSTPSGTAKMRAHKVQYNSKPGHSDGSDSSGSFGDVSPTRGGSMTTAEPLSPTYSVKSDGSSPVHRSYNHQYSPGGGFMEISAIQKDKKREEKYRQNKFKSADSSPAHGINNKKPLTTYGGRSILPNRGTTNVVGRCLPDESHEQIRSEHSQKVEVSDLFSEKDGHKSSSVVASSVIPIVHNGFVPAGENVNSNVNNDNNLASSASDSVVLATNKPQNCDFQVQELTSEPKSPRKNVSRSSRPPETVVPDSDASGSVQTSPKSKQSPGKHRKTKTEKGGNAVADHSIGEESQGHRGKPATKSPSREANNKRHRSPKNNKKSGSSIESQNELKFLDGDDETPPPPYSACTSSPTHSQMTKSSPDETTRSPTASQESPVRQLLQPQNTVATSVVSTTARPTQGESVARVDQPQVYSVPPGSGPSSPDSDTGSIYHQPLKDVDVPSASRLAKRLYDLDGFRKQDISKHLSKKNEFAQQVGEEYLKYFDFGGEGLDSSLRKFLRHITLAGETQERERVLVHFSRRYVLCNPESYNSEDAAHTLTCALLLLNTDLHGQNVGQKMSVGEFIENLSDLNDGENFPKEVLKSLYHAIKTEPLEWEFDEGSDGLQLDLDLLQATTLGVQRQLPGEQQKYLGHNPFLDVPDPTNAIDFKKGYVMRKCCVDPDGRKTAVGKRGWKMLYGILKDMILYLYKDEHAHKKSGQYENLNNAIRVHHAYATKATDYKKKQHVFRLQTAEMAEYLFQTSNPEECQNWMDNINLVAAMFSAPPLPGAVGSQRKFQRPLLPASYTKYNLREQYQHHEQKLQHLDHELMEHRKYPPEKGSKARVIQEYIDKEQYLQFELRRFKTYCYLLQSKMTASFPGDLEPSLVETTICEVSEPSSPGTEHKDSESPLSHAPTSSSTSSPKSSSSTAKKSPKRSDKDRKDRSVHREKTKSRSSVQRSQSDRVSRDRKAKSLPEGALLQRYQPGADTPQTYSTAV